MVLVLLPKLQRTNALPHPMLKNNGEKNKRKHSNKNEHKKSKKEKKEQNRIRFATLNTTGISGKIDILKNLINTSNIDWIFLTETNTMPGASNIDSNIIFQQGHPRTRETGHYPYGQALLINPSR